MKGKREIYYIVKVEEGKAELLSKASSMKEAKSLYDYSSAIAKLHRTRAISNETIHIFKLVK